LIVALTNDTCKYSVKLLLQILEHFEHRDPKLYSRIVSVLRGDGDSISICADHFEEVFKLARDYIYKPVVLEEKFKFLERVLNFQYNLKLPRHEIESYLVDSNKKMLYLLSVDNYIALPMDCTTRVLVTSDDVIHS
jgi:heme/copper-type cytochrome/quinol oxidase subunit 2